MTSPYAQVGAKLVERGYAAIPIMPGTKRPGHIIAGTWVGMNDWRGAYARRLPTETEVEGWGGMAGAGVCVVAGPASNDTIGVDIDVEDGPIVAAIMSVLPHSPVRKAGQKGFTPLFRGAGVVSRSFNEVLADGTKGRRLCDIIGPGRQMVLPPSVHPETRQPYRWIGEVALEMIDPADLPEVPPDLADRIGAALAPFGYRPDPPPARESVDGDNPFRTVNDAAMANLGSWVPRLGLHGLRPARGGYEAVATWRGSSSGQPLERRKRNLKIHPSGIRDMGADLGFTALDLVMTACGCDLDTAFGQLSGWLGRSGGIEIDLQPKRRVERQGGVLIDAETGEILPEDDDPQDGQDWLATPFQWCDPSKIPKRRWLYGGHYIRRFVSATIAPGGIGKSSLTIIEALAMATRRPLLNIHPPEPLKVWLWNGEDPLEEIQRRIAASCLYYGIQREDIAGRLFTDSGRERELIIATESRTGTIIAKPLVEKLIATIIGLKIDVLIIDPFVASHRVSENDNMAIDLVAKQWGIVAERANCAIELVHHARKTAGHEVTVEHARGASSLISAARSVRALNGMTEEEGKKVGIFQPRLYFRSENGKANLAPPPNGATWYHLTSVPLGNGDDGFGEDGFLDTGDVVGVVAPWEWPVLSSELSENVVVEIIVRAGQGDHREDARSPQWFGYVVAEVLDWDAKGSEAKQAIKKIVEKLIDDQRLKVVEAPDNKRMMRRFVVPGDKGVATK